LITTRYFSWGKNISVQDIWADFFVVHHKSKIGKGIYQYQVLLLIIVLGNLFER